jgi:alkylation response protein AidB-like acyl-CoA dehydrogenase
VRYAKERIAFSEPIIELQGIQFKLADIQTGAAAARELLYKACTLADKTPAAAHLGMWTSMAKLLPPATP